MVSINKRTLPCQGLLLFPTLQTLVLVINGSMKNLFLLLFLGSVFPSLSFRAQRDITLALCLAVHLLPVLFFFPPTAEPFRHP